MIKTGFLKWSKDYLGAISHFEKAGDLYMQEGNKEMATEAYLKYSLCGEKINELYSAADGLVKAAFTEKDKNKAYGYLQQALNLYKINDNGKEGFR